MTRETCSITWILTLILIDMNLNAIKAIQLLGRFIVFFTLDSIANRVVAKAVYEKGLRDGMKEVNNSKSKGK